MSDDTPRVIGRFGAGGVLPGPESSMVPVYAVGHCFNGHPLYRIGGGEPEHVLLASERGSWAAILYCQSVIDAARRADQ